MADTESRLRRFRWYRRSRLWVVPSMCVAAALLLAAGSLLFDDLVLADRAPFPVFTGEADTARSILSLIATSMATLLALILTIVAVVLQLATQTLSPRAVRTFLQDPQTHIALGSFVGTFTYALAVLQQLNVVHDPDTDLLTSSSVTIAFGLAVFSIGMFISYVDHIIHHARVTSIIDRIGSDTRAAIERQHPARQPEARGDTNGLPEGDPDAVVRSPTHGVILEIDVPGLIEAIAERDVVVVMVPSVGDFIPTGGRLLEVHGAEEVDLDALLRAVAVDAERSITQDATFGFRLLVDIAERALSPGVNDPTTATEVLGRLHDLLHLLGTRPFPDGWHRDGEGHPRLHVPQPSWELYVALAFEEIRHYGAASLQVVRRIRSIVEDLLAELPEDRHPPLRRQLTLLDEVAERSFTSDAEQRAARHPDAQGIGSGNGFGAEQAP